MRNVVTELVDVSLTLLTNPSRALEQRQAELADRATPKQMWVAERKLAAKLGR